jgi:hypothetical protein
MSVSERAKQHELGWDKGATWAPDNAPRPKPSERKENAGSESAPRVGFRLGGGVFQNKRRGNATKQMRGPDQYTALGWQRRARAGLGEA